MNSSGSRKYIYWAASVLLIAGIVASFYYMKEEHPLGSLGTGLEEGSAPDLAISLRNTKLVGRSQCSEIWRFEAQRIDLSRDRRVATFSDISRGVLLQDGREIALLSAGRAVYDTLTQDVNVPGSAEISIRNGPVFKAHNIRWSAGDSRIICQEGIKATFNGSTLLGDSLVADLNHKEIVITNVRGRIRLPAEISP